MLTNLCFRKSIRFIILIQTLLFSIESHSQDKYALLMGISEYPVSSEWPSTYADNDLNLIKNSLIYRGFKQEHIFLLLDSQCTREGILSAFNDSLLPILTKGSMVYIHYSGLGQQFIDLDYTEPDGFDEAIVPYDAPPKYIEASFSPSRFILDDELESYFSKIQHKLGAAGQLLVTMDSYSAPDRIRSTAKARGNNDYSESTREDFHTFFSISPEQKSKAPMISIHNSDQNTGIQEFYSREYGSFGLFSYAIAKSIATLSQHSNYDSWFQEIRSFMKHQTVKQNPILFGGVKKFAFNDMLSKKKMFYRIDKIYSKDLVKIEGGSLHQFEKGTEMLIYAPDVEDTTGRNLLGRGVVEQVNLLDSELRIIETYSPNIPLESKIFVSKLQFRPLVLSLEIKIGNSSLAEKLKTHFTFSPFIRQVDIKADVTLRLRSDKILQLINRTGDVLFEEPMDLINESEIAFKLNDLMAEYVRAKFLRNLNIGKSLLENQYAQLQLIASVDPSKPSYYSKQKIGSRYKLIVTNNSEQGRYFSILQIKADHTINVLIPHDKESREYYLLPGQSYVTDFDMEVNAPAGMEVFKLFMTNKPLDLRPVIATRGVYNILSDNPKNSLELLFGNLFVEHPVTGSTELKINVSDIQSVSELNVEVVDVQ